MEILSKIFGNAAKVKIMRLFLLNADHAYDVVDVSDRAKTTSTVARREIALLEKIKFIKKKTYTVEIEHWRGQHMRIEKRKVQGWILNERFPYLRQLRSLLVSTPALAPREILQKLARAGKIKLLIITGIFIQDPDSRVDMLIVGDNLKENALESTMQVIESEVGKELRYTAFETSQFSYRLSIYDRLIRDILDYPHETVINRLNFPLSRE